MRFRLDDDEFEFLDFEDMLWAEISAVEKHTGLTQAEITAQGQVCGCGHRISLHELPKDEEHPDDPEDPTEDRVCTTCGCDQPQSNLPARVFQAQFWVSLKRVRPELTFQEAGQIGVNAAVPVEEEAADPTTGDGTPELSEAENQDPTPAPLSVA